MVIIKVFRLLVIYLDRESNPEMINEDHENNLFFTRLRQLTPPLPRKVSSCEIGVGDKIYRIIDGGGIYGKIFYQ